MKISQLISLVVLLCCSLTFTAYANSKTDLYTGKVVVASENPADRERGIQQAFAQVLVKLSGKTQTGQDLGLSSEPAKASQWVQQYRYEETPGAEGATTTWLIASFDPPAINNYLKKSNVAIWGGDRPLTLVWMAVEENGTQNIVGEYELGLMNWQQWFSNESRARGVPVLFPLLDLTDKQQVAISDVWYHVTDVLRTAGERYQAQNILSGRIYKNIQTDIWSADWSLSLPADKVDWQQTASTPEELIKISVDRFADELGKRSSSTELAVTDTSNIQLKVDNINDLQAYLRVLTYLQSLNAVDTIAASLITSSSVTFRIGLTEGLALFQQKLTQDNLLKALPDNNDAALHYQYL